MELDDFILDHLLTLNFDSTILTFSSIYEKLVTFLRNKETIAPAQAHIEASVFTAQMVNVFNVQWQKRENQKRKFDANEFLVQILAVADVSKGEAFKAEVMEADLGSSNADLMEIRVITQTNTAQISTPKSLSRFRN